MEFQWEIVSVDLKFFLSEQRSEHAWLRGRGWAPLNVETYKGGDGKDKQRIWLKREVAADA